MLIEVAIPPDKTNNDKGDLLENLTKDFLATQSYEIEQKVRVTGSELDLLCKHKINKKIVYVECKAHRENLGAGAIKNLLGTIEFKGYNEGWLFSAGPLGKEAKGMKGEWEDKPPNESQKLSIYDPKRVINVFTNSKTIIKQPNDKAIDIVKDEDLLGTWMLLITPFGRHWTITCLEGGVPEGLLVFSADTGQLITEKELLNNLSKTDTNLRDLDFEYVFRVKSDTARDKQTADKTPVVEVQFGDSWADYRPARPKDFVGRKKAQNKIVSFLNRVRSNESQTRIFSITGDSGLGKSSLIIKLRDRLRNKRYRNRFYMFAVDVRAAKSAKYIYSSLLACLNKASEIGFGFDNHENFKISDHTDPLKSPSISSYLESLENKDEVICLVFDQFEELYSKAELFEVFEVAQNLFLSTVSAQSNLVLGFAWKSDSTVQQTHPAYYMWHRLSDHRIEIEVRRFQHSEASKAIRVFENELGEKIRSSLRRQLIENSQGYPWLLKKLCIHIYEQIKDGASQAELMDKALDVESLFERDLQKLSKAESTCLKLIAENAPVDWFEILETSDQNTLNSLLDKRLVVRSGDRLNVYWDIFREYVVNKKVPSIPLTYLPDYASLRTTLMIANQLNNKSYISYSNLAESSNLKETTVGNVVRDLIMFGVAKRSQSQVKLDERMDSSEPRYVLQKLRETLRHHALTVNLRELEQGTLVSAKDIIKYLKEINPAAQHREETWKAYADRMCQWLVATGYLVDVEGGWKVEDKGKIDSGFANLSVGYYRRDNIFMGETSPAKTVEALLWLLADVPKSWKEMKEAGYRNATSAMRSLGVIKNVSGKYTLTEEYLEIKDDPKRIIWKASKADKTLAKVINYMNNNPTASGTKIGHFINQEYGRNWAESSKQRIGNSLKKWARWLILGHEGTNIPQPLGRASRNLSRKQEKLFG